MSDYLQQPAVAALLRMLKSKRGATIQEMAKARKYEEHTVRSMLSRIRSLAGLDLFRSKSEKRGLVFRLGKRTANA